MRPVNRGYLDVSISMTPEEAAESAEQNIRSQGIDVDWTLWIILWLAYGVACIFVATQAFGKQTTGLSPSDANTPSPGRGRRNRSSNSRDVEQGRAETSEGGHSSGDKTRRIFYQVLLVALLSRFALLPLQAWDHAPSWWKFFGDTFPIMTFASAWVVLVSFFVQLVETATGMMSESTNKNTIVMQVIAYVMYSMLLMTYVWNDAAILLMYALLACIHAALFATLVYFGPKLVSILQPSLRQRSGLAVRLISSGLLCLVVFAGRTVELSRKVLLFQQNQPLWWFAYAIFELFPSIALLVMMKKQRKSNRNSRNRGGSGASPSAVPGTTTSPPTASTTAAGLLDKKTKSLPTVKSYSKPPQSKVSTTSETTPLLRPTNATGAAYGTSNANRSGHPSINRSSTPAS